MGFPGRVKSSCTLFSQTPKSSALEVNSVKKGIEVSPAVFHQSADLDVWQRVTFGGTPDGKAVRSYPQVACGLLTIEQFRLRL
jgi:hypothetical protein